MAGCEAHDAYTGGLIIMEENKHLNVMEIFGKGMEIGLVVVLLVATSINVLYLNDMMEYSYSYGAMFIVMAWLVATNLIKTINRRKCNKSFGNNVIYLVIETITMLAWMITTVMSARK